VAHIAAAPLFFAHAIGDPKVAGQAQPSLSALLEVLQRMLAVPEIEHFADYASWETIKREREHTEVTVVSVLHTSVSIVRSMIVCHECMFVTSSVHAHLCGLRLHLRIVPRWLCIAVPEATQHEPWYVSW